MTIRNQQPLRVWRSGALLANEYMHDSKDGIQLGRVALDYVSFENGGIYGNSYLVLNTQHEQGYNDE
jgi:hypothetical protein